MICDYCLCILLIKSVYSMWHLFVGDTCTAQYLNGQQYIDLGSYRDQCMGNLEMCPDGYTLAFWIKADDFRYCSLSG